MTSVVLCLEWFKSYLDTKHRSPRMQPSSRALQCHQTTVIFRVIICSFDCFFVCIWQCMAIFEAHKNWKHILIILLILKKKKLVSYFWYFVSFQKKIGCHILSILSALKWKLIVPLWVFCRHWKESKRLSLLAVCTKRPPL